MASGGYAQPWNHAHDDDLTSPLQTPLHPPPTSHDGVNHAAGPADGFPYPTSHVPFDESHQSTHLFGPKEHRPWVEDEEGQVDHASTPPITIPIAHHESASNNEQWPELSPFERAFERRRRSISFHPQVTLDGGHETKNLEEPVSGWRARSRRSGGRCMWSELSQQRERPMGGANNGTSVRQRRMFAPSLIIHPSPTVPMNGEHPSRRGGLLADEPGARPSPTMDELTTDGYGERRERMASLTSTSTASPPPDDPHTPPESPGELSLSPAMSLSLNPLPASAEESQVWPVVSASHLDPPRRTRSETFGKVQPLRRGKRNASLRSPDSMSPASMFLSMLGKASAAAAAPAPDDAGQEVGEYVLGRQIGFGGFSIVREAHGIEGGEPVRRAVKIVRKRVDGRTETENEALQAELEQEVAIWRCLHHPRILPLLVVYDTPDATFCFTELHPDGTLFDLIRGNRQGVGIHLARRYARQLALALRYLHQDMRVVHRDVKLENCLLDLSEGGDDDDRDEMNKGGNIRLCDFGMAEYLPSDDDDINNGRNLSNLHPHATHRLPPPAADPASSNNTSSVVGSLEYASPELLVSSTPMIATGVDIWAYGVVLYALLVGDLPFRHTFLPRVQMMILKGEWDEQAVRNACSGTGAAAYSHMMDATSNIMEIEAALELLRGCMQKDVTKRWDIEQVLGSAFLQADPINDPRQGGEARVDEGIHHHHHHGGLQQPQRQAGLVEDVTAVAVATIQVSEDQGVTMMI
ncbi:MAG: hypothetical protein M1823_003292 [Watsoniomyces obsoletus]|nr:MAG: hypothetical protein M1823_003292 [Watsoniomyces obsoletus]